MSIMETKNTILQAVRWPKPIHKWLTRNGGSLTKRVIKLCEEKMGEKDGPV